VKPLSENQESHLVSGRECGECTVCCEALHIDDGEFKKPADKACSQMVEKGGCKIYASRPNVCQDWHCAWRFMEQLGDDWRPDRSGILLRSDENGIIFQPIRNPRKVLTTERAIELIGGGIAQGIQLSMSIPTKKNHRSFSTTLNDNLETAVKSRNFAVIKSSLLKLIKKAAAEKTDPLTAAEKRVKDDVFLRG